MREIFKSGSVGRAPGNRCFYPEPGRNRPPSRLIQYTWLDFLKFTLSVAPGDTSVMWYESNPIVVISLLSFNQV